MKVRRAMDSKMVKLADKTEETMKEWAEKSENPGIRIQTMV
ncbi:MAG: hypothetical protein ABR999_10675 [Methanoregula sp.]